MTTIRPMGQPGASIMLVGDIPCPKELQEGRAWEGSAGWELRKMLSEAGIVMSSCYQTLICKTWIGPLEKLVLTKKKDITDQYVQYRDRMVHHSLLPQIKLLEEEIRTHNPTLIIALGDLPAFFLTGQWSSRDWRGSTVQGELFPGCPKVLITIHPRQVLKEWPLRAPVVNDLRRALGESQYRHLTPTNYHLITRPGLEQVLSLLAGLLAEAQSAHLAGETKRLAVDIETRNWHIACLGIAWSKTEAISIPFMSLAQPDGHYWNQYEEGIIIHSLYRLLTHPAILVIGQNFIFDQQYIHRYWHFICPRVRDTMIAQHTCFPGMPKSLDYIASLYCSQYRYWKGDGKIWAGADEQANWLYNAEDCCRTFECDTVLQTIVDQLGLRYAHDFQQSLFHPVLMTMIRGVQINHEAQKTLIQELREAQSSCMNWLQTVIGRPVNPKSPKQIADLFYTDLGQTPIHNRTTGGETTNSEALEKVATREPILRPIVQKIEELRSIGIFLSTFLGERTGKWTRDFLDEDGRIRCSYNIAGTVTFRFASGESAFGHGTNLQNIPKGDE